MTKNTTHACPTCADVHVPFRPDVSAVFPAPVDYELRASKIVWFTSITALCLAGVLLIALVVGITWALAR
jgi:hypothetical protein